MAKKPSLGRQKIKIAKIEIKNHLQVTFSKRRSGLFKKASELCILCGVEVAIIVFSPAGKVFSFGHPHVEPIIDRFLSRGDPMIINTPVGHHLVEAHRNASVREMNVQLSRMLAEVEEERKRGETLDGVRKSRTEREFWWERPIEELGLGELDQLRNCMDELRKNVAVQMEKIVDAVNATSTLFAGNGTSGWFDLAEVKPRGIMAGLNDNHHHHHLNTHNNDHDVNYHHHHGPLHNN
ncbi:unnamed protein product, partial [Cuscuta epithymum]